MRKLVVLFIVLACSLTSFAQSRDGSCDPIDSLIIVDTLGNLTILWNVNDTTLAFDYRYRLLGDTVWICETTLDSFFVIDEGGECVEYEVGISTVCPFDTSGYTLDTIISFCPSDTTNAGPPDPSVLRVYPVPFDSELTIATSGAELDILSVVIRNLQGQIMSTSTNENQLRLETAAWSSGVYLIEVETSAGREIRKVLRL
jgi:hypothetical protein